MNFCKIVSSQLELRLWNFSEKENLFNLIEENRKFLYRWLRFIENIKSPKDATGLISEGLDGYAKNTSLNLAIYYNNELSGNIVLEYDVKTHFEGEISYWIGERFQNKGLISRCMKILLNEAFSNLNLNRVKLLIAESNVKSLKVAKKQGFTYEGTTRESYKTNNEFQNIRIYSLLKKEYEG
ncbi:MAG: GNAT family protein [Patescibacteria group bacterium]